MRTGDGGRRAARSSESTQCTDALLQIAECNLFACLCRPLRMASSWLELHGTFYDFRELYSLPWGVDVETSRVAVSPFGGPVAVTRDGRKIVKSAVGQARGRLCRARRWR